VTKTKFIYQILIFSFLVTASHAQILRGYGFKIGATLASEDWDYTRLSTDFTPDSRWGFNLGVFGEFLNIPYFSLVTELNYVQKGMTKELPVTTITHPDGTGEYVTWDSRIDYLNLSALGKLRSGFGLFTPYIFIGPKIDFELGVDNSLGTTNEVEENFNSIMYGLKVGGGTEIKLTSFSLLAEIIYDYNFNDLYKNEYLTVTASSVDFRIGIIF
jgi:hypothetical protein